MPLPVSPLPLAPGQGACASVAPLAQLPPAPPVGSVVSVVPAAASFPGIMSVSANGHAGAIPQAAAPNQMGIQQVAYGAPGLSAGQVPQVQQMIAYSELQKAMQNMLIRGNSQNDH